MRHKLGAIGLALLLPSFSASAQSAEQTKDDRASECFRARFLQRGLGSNPTVYRQDEDGNRTYDAAQSARMKQQIEDDVKKWCGD
jgi:hypothetical protein